MAAACTKRPLFPMFGNGFLAGPGTLIDALASDTSLAPLTPLQKLRWTVKTGLGRLVCMVQGCHFKTPYFQSNRLYFCTRCDREMFGRTFEDLTPEPMDEVDWPWWEDGQ